MPQAEPLLFLLTAGCGGEGKEGRAEERKRAGGRVAGGLCFARAIENSSYDNETLPLWKTVKGKY